MKNTAIASLVLVTAAPLCAQRYLYSPPFIATTEGRRFAYLPGAFSDARYQLLDGDHRGKVAVIKEIALRLDYRTHTLASARGRSWKSVRIQMGDGDRKAFRGNFAANIIIGPPTTVFSASVTWPTFNGVPKTSPTPWGGTTGAYRFPFTTQWLYLGQKDIISDWTFSGGTLAGNLVWPRATLVAYQMDGWFVNTTQLHPAFHANHPRIRLNNNSPGVTGRCNDSVHGRNVTGAYMVASGTVYGPWYSTVQYRSKLVMFSSSYYTAPGAAVIHAWGVNPNAPGIDIGTGCNRLHVGNIVLLQTFATAPRAINPTGFSGFAPFLVIPWDKNMSSFKVITQGAWVDSSTARLNLTQARQMTLPSVDFQQKAPVRLCAYKFNQSGPFVTNVFYLNPALRYAH